MNYAAGWHLHIMPFVDEAAVWSFLPADGDLSLHSSVWFGSVVPGVITTRRCQKINLRDYKILNRYKKQFLLHKVMLIFPDCPLIFSLRNRVTLWHNWQTNATSDKMSFWTAQLPWSRHDHVAKSHSQLPLCLRNTVVWAQLTVSGCSSVLIKSS